jgi:hypothetical protein
MRSEPERGAVVCPREQVISSAEAGDDDRRRSRSLPCDPIAGTNAAGPIEHARQRPH